MQFHQSNLRKGRVSITGQYYSITKCCEKNAPFLIPENPQDQLANIIFLVIKEIIQWLNENEYWMCKNFVMMPDHVHLVFELGEKKSLDQTMHSFSSFSSKKINKALNRSGKLWQNGYYDHAIRDEKSLNRQIEYIASNPVRSGFVEKPEDWPFQMIEYLR